MKERTLQKVVLDYLSAKKIFHWRNNSGAFKTDRGGFYRFGAVGSPDIFVVLKIKKLAVVVGLEIKSKNGKQSAVQKQWQKEFESNNGFYFIIKDINELEDKLDFVKNKVLTYLKAR